jgi:spore coat polysaccharide biosynthesis protein SpsF
MRTVAIIQARMGSTRLPGKVLMKLAGETVLGRVVRRVKRASRVDEVVIATTLKPVDGAIVGEAERLGVKSFRGPEEDVLDRYYQAATACDAEVVVRITSDCPLVDPELVDGTVEELLTRSAAYASNTLERSYPRGLDVEVFTRRALWEAHREARAAYEREHVTPYIFEHPEKFRLASVKGDGDYSRYRWTLDTPQDFALLEALCSRLGTAIDFGWREALAVMEREPGLAGLNAHIQQKALHRN